MRTMKELCQQAINIQDASNLSGVVHAFASSITELRTLLMQQDGFNTSRLNQHPVCVLYSSKIASLTGSETNYNEESGNTFSEAYGFCTSHAE